MVNNLTPIEKLDEVLKIIASVELTDGSIRTEFISIKLNQIGIKINVSELERIIDKLVKDDYADFEDKVPSPNTPFSLPHYFITFDGFLLLENGGYKQDLINKNSETKRIDDLDKKSIYLSDRMNRLTFWVVVGSIGLLLMEIVKFVVANPHFFCFGH